jgi:hypothetical protein
VTDEDLEDLAIANSNYEPLRTRLIALFKEVRNATAREAAEIADSYHPTVGRLICAHFGLDPKPGAEGE